MRSKTPKTEHCAQFQGLSRVMEGGWSPGRSKTPQTEHHARFRGLLRVVEGGWNPGRLKTPKTEHCAWFRGLSREVKAQGGQKPPKLSIMLDFGGCWGRSNQNWASCSVLGVVEGHGRRLKPGEVENPPNQALCLISGLVESCGRRSKPGKVENPQNWAWPLKFGGCSQSCWGRWYYSNVKLC